MTVNGPDPVPDPELVLLLDGWAVRQKAGNDHPERSHVNDNDKIMMIKMMIMMVSTVSHLLAVKGASSGGCSLCPGRMPRVYSNSCTEARESALRPLAATSLESDIRKHQTYGEMVTYLRWTSMSSTGLVPSKKDSKVLICP